MNFTGDHGCGRPPRREPGARTRCGSTSTMLGVDWGNSSFGDARPGAPAALGDLARDSPRDENSLVGRLNSFTTRLGDGCKYECDVLAGEGQRSPDRPESAN